jgi:ribosomal protein S18 acetylase RimI-like enzyme
MSVSFYKSQGFSMEPFLLDGDELLIDASPKLRLRLGDIVLYRSAEHGRPVAHRLVGLEPLVARSDAFPKRTETFRPEDVVGRVEEIRRGNKLIRVGSSWKNAAVARALPAALAVKEAAARLALPALSVLQKTKTYRRWAAGWAVPEIREAAGPGLVRFSATVRGRYAGGADLEGRDGVGRVTSVHVRARYRGAGIARRLLDAVDARAKKDGLVELRLEGSAAPELYRAAGYEPAATGGLRKAVR